MTKIFPLKEFSMNKKILLFQLFFIHLFSFSNSYQLYQTILKSKEVANSGNYSESIAQIKSIHKSFPNSYLVKSNYLNFDLSLNYYYNNDLKNAIFYMKKAIYSPQHLQGGNYFFQKRNYFLALFYLTDNNFPQAKPFLDAIISDSTLFLSTSELKLLIDTFSNLKIKDSSLRFYLPILKKIYFGNQISNLNNLTTQELINMGNLFFNKKDYITSENIFKFLYSKEKNNSTINEFFLRTLFFQRKFKDIIEISHEMLKNNSNIFIYYYRAQSFIYQKNLSLALSNFRRINSQNFYSHDNFYMNSSKNLTANIYFAIEEYHEIISLSKLKVPQSFDSDFLLILSYFQAQNYSKGKKEALTFIKKYPFTLKSNFLLFLIESTANRKTNVSLNKISTILLQDSFTNFREALFYSLNSLPIFDEKSTLENEFLKKETFDSNNLFKILELNSPELLSVAINSTFPIYNNKTLDLILINRLLSQGNQFNEAYLFAKSNFDIFSQYKNLKTALYPKHYQEIVNKNSIKYDIPEEIIYTTILLTSKFKKEFYIPEKQAGLMGISLKEISIPIKEAFIPEINIEEGTKQLKKLLIKNNNNSLPTLVEYLYGEEIKNSIYFDNNKFYINTLIPTDIKNDMELLLETLIYYQILYPIKL